MTSIGNRYAAQKIRDYVKLPIGHRYAVTQHTDSDTTSTTRNQS